MSLGRSLNEMVINHPKYSFDIWYTMMHYDTMEYQRNKFGSIPIRRVLLESFGYVFHSRLIKIIFNPLMIPDAGKSQL